MHTLKSPKQKWIVVTAVIFSFITSTVLFAATPFSSKVKLVSSVQTISPSTEFTVAVSLDSINMINAADMQVIYPPDTVEFISVDKAHSIIGFWQAGNILLSKGHVHLVGGMYPSYQGQDGHIATLHFKAISTGNVSLTVDRGTLYLADGKGTTEVVPGSVSTVKIASSISIVPTVQVPTPLKNIDITAPLLTVRSITDPTNGADLIVYEAIDKESGIRSVESRSFAWGRWTTWNEVSNPFTYPSNSWKIEVRAMNMNGIVAEQSISFVNNTLIYGLCTLLLIIVVYTVRRRLKKI